jgi:hypothetical protein
MYHCCLFVYSIDSSNDFFSGKKEDLKQISPFLTYGFYSSKFSFTYKLMEAASPNALVIQQKFTFKPVLQLQMENAAMVTVMQGGHFFDFSFGVRSIKCVRLPTHTEPIQQPSISEVTQNSSDEIVWLQCGAFDEPSSTDSCLHSSLFADMSFGSSVDTVQSAYEKHNIKACSNQFTAVWIQYRYTAPYAPSGEPSDNTGMFDNWLLDRKQETTEQVIVIGDIQVVLTHVVKSLLDDVIISGSKWNEHSESDSVPAEPAESIEQALKRYSYSGYNFDLMRQRGVPMKTMQFTCKELNVVLASGGYDKQLQEFLSSKSGDVLTIPQDQLPVYLHVSGIQCSMSIPIYPDQLKVDGPNPYRSVASLPNSCFSVVLGEVSNIKVAFSPPNQPEEVESLDCSSSVLSCPELHIKLQHSLLPPDWHQPGQLCNQQIVTIPSLSVEASGPQLMLAYGCYAAVVLGSDKMVLSNHQKMSGHISLHCKLSSVKWESSLWPDVSSYSGSVHDIVLFISSADDVETHVSYIPLVCGPIATEKIYDGSLLLEKTRHDLMKGKQDDVLSFKSQIPILSDNTVGSKRTTIPLFVVTVKGMAFNLDPLLYRWITSLIPAKSMGGASSQENDVGGAVSIDTGHSVEHSSYQHASKVKPKVEANSGVHDMQTRLLQWWPTVSKMNINVTVLPLAIFMPTDNCPGLRSSDDIYCHDISAYYSALVSHSSAWPPLCPTLVTCLPHITVVSCQFREEFKDSSFKPISVATDKSLKLSTLPWSVTCSNFSLYTLHPTQSGANESECNLFFLVEPGSLDVVIAPSSGVGRTSEGATGSYALHLAKELTVCCHISVHSISLSVSRKQIQVVKCVTQAVMSCVGQIMLMTAKPPSDSGIHSLRSLHQCAQNVHHSASEMRTFTSTDVSSSHYTEDNIRQWLKETTYSFWIQLMVPKLSVSVYHRLKVSHIQEKGELIRVYAELEDTSASADFSDVCTSGKLSIGFIAVKHSKMDSDNTWINGLYSGLLLGSSKAPMFPQGHVIPVVPQSKSSISLSFRYVYGSASRRHCGLDLKLTLLPLTVIPWLPTLNTVIDAFDIVPQTQKFNETGVSVHDIPNEQPLQEKEPHVEIPQLHIDVDDIVVLLPVDQKVAVTNTDRVILFRLSLLSLKPRPQNPIARPVLGAHETSFSKLEGYSCEEKQLQLNISTIEVWTGEWDDVASNVTSVAHEILSDTASSVGEQNPALEWNLIGRSQIGQSARLIPVVRDVAVQSVVAPALSSVVKLEDGPCRLTFGHSLEINLVSDLRITLNNEQILLFLHMLDELSSQFSSVSSSDTTAVNSSNPAMPCEVLMTASKISFTIYSVVENSALPLLHATVIQPSLRWSNMSNAVELKVNCYNFNLQAGQSDHPLNLEDLTALDSPSNFPLTIITTRPGKRNSSGILPSLLYLTVNKPENGSVVIDCKLARPLFADIRLSLLVQALKFVQSITTSLRGKANVAADSAPSVITDKDASKCIHPTVMISSLQIGLSLSAESSSVCANLKSMSASFYGGNLTDTGHGGTASFDSLSIDTKHETRQVYLLLPVDIAVNVEVTMVEGSNVSSLATAFMKIVLSPVVVKLGTLHYHCFEAIKNDSTVCELMSLMSHMTSTKIQHDSNPVCEPDGIRWESEDDIRSGALEYVFQMSEVEKHPDPGQIVFTSGVRGMFPAMSWCYHEPRAISSIQALPLPISAANEVSLDPENDEIQCWLRYYDIAKQGYVEVIDFSLLQTEVLNVELPDTTVAAHKWQVVMAVSHDDDNVSDGTSDTVIRDSQISPMVLAGCLKINSYFSTSLVPSLNVLLEASCLEIKLMNYITNLGQLERDDSVFVFDGTLPWEHDVARVQMNDTQVHGKLWLGSIRQNAVIQMDSRLHVDYVDFTCLQWQPFVYPFDIRLHFIWKPVIPSITSSSHRDERTVLSLNMESLIVNLSQSLLHTMGRLLLAWQRSDPSVSVVMNQYFICNSTIESLEFAQVNSEEVITLSSGQCHAYFWKSTFPHLLRARIALDQVYNWSETFSVEKESTLAIELNIGNGKSVTMMALVHHDGAICTVVFTGSLQLVNGLLCALEICLQTDRSENRIFKLQGQEKGLSVMENGKMDILVRQDLRHPLQADWSMPVQIQLSNDAGKIGTIALPVHLVTNQVVHHHIAFSLFSRDPQKNNNLQVDVQHCQHILISFSFVV